VLKRKDKDAVQYHIGDAHGIHGSENFIHLFVIFKVFSAELIETLVRKAFLLLLVIFLVVLALVASAITSLALVLVAWLVFPLLVIATIAVVILPAIAANAVSTCFRMKNESIALDGQGVMRVRA